MNKRINISSLSLMVLLILILLTSLSVVSLVSARSDLMLAKKQASLVTNWAECNTKGNIWLSELDVTKDKTIGTQFTDNEGHILRVLVEIKDNSYTIKEWKYYTTWENTENNQVWEGK